MPYMLHVACKRLVETARSGNHPLNLAAMRNLVDRSFAEVRLSAGLPIVRGRIAVDEFIRDFAVDAGMQARSKSIQFTVHPVEKGIAVDADRQMLTAAVSNLLQNAFEFTPPNGRVSLKAHASHDRVLIDTGYRAHRPIGMLT